MSSIKNIIFAVCLLLVCTLQATSRDRLREVPSRIVPADGALVFPEGEWKMGPLIRILPDPVLKVEIKVLRQEIADLKALVLFQERKNTKVLEDLRADICILQSK